MRAIELFAGVGGFRLGLERNGHEVVWANEWDKWSCDTYDKNFGGQIDRRDITTIPASDIREHDLIVGGFPCQAFSIAGKRGGFADIRGTLFFDIMRIAEHHKTPYLLLENVRGLLSHDKGRTFGTILATLDDLGYDCQWQVCNSKDFGVPQNRERVYIIGHLRGHPRPEVFPITGAERADTRSEQDVEPAAQGIATRHLDRNGGLLSAIASTVQVAEVPHIVAGIGWHGRGDEIRSDNLANALKASGGGGTKNQFTDLSMIRRLTPVECERLQGFPDGWTAGVSDTQRYKQMGNAVTVNVVEAVASRLETKQEAML